MRARTAALVELPSQPSSSSGRYGSGHGSHR